MGVVLSLEYGRVMDVKEEILATKLYNCYATLLHCRITVLTNCWWYFHPVKQRKFVARENMSNKIVQLVAQHCWVAGLQTKCCWYFHPGQQ